MAGYSQVYLESVVQQHHADLARASRPRRRPRKRRRGIGPALILWVGLVLGALARFA